MIENSQYNDSQSQELNLQKQQSKVKKTLKKIKPLAILDNKYFLIKKLGKGSTATVYLGFAPKDPNHKLYSFKVISKAKISDLLFKKEVQTLLNLNHKNILKIYHSGESIIKDQNNKIKEVYFIIEEYMKYGELLNYIYLTKGFGENYGRIIFESLLDGIEYLHNNNIVHRDIKVDNIMISDDLNIKLVDFGFATNAFNKNKMDFENETNNKKGKLNTFLGTPNYAAPELHLKIPYYGKSNDIFSLGVTLFVIVTGTLPFKIPLLIDPLYQFIYKNDYIGFWIKKKLNLSQSFMELFESLVAFDYSQRPTISEIRNSRWMKEIDESLKVGLKEEFKQKILEINKRDKENIVRIGKNETCVYK